MIKRLSGGLILLCLTSISLGVTSGEVSITDPEVLEQLKELRNFIDVNRDFTKGFKNLKPVLVEYRSSASKFNGIALGNLSFNTDALHMSIGINTIQADGKMLVVTINVVYAWSDYIGYQVSSAKLTAYETLATGDGTFTGDVGVGGDLEVTGDASFGDIIQIGDETDPSFKPIYYHGIEMYNSDTNEVVELHILNNSSTAFTSVSNLVSWANSITGEVKIAVTGVIKISDNNYAIPYVIVKSSAGVFSIYYVTFTSGYSNTGFSNVNLAEYFANIKDAVNKIN